MGIEFVARAVPLPGSIREVPINVKERRPGLGPDRVVCAGCELKFKRTEIISQEC